MRYRFGEFELDTEAYVLSRAGRPLQLQPKVFDLLRFLIEHRGRIVTKQELQDGLWEVEHVHEGVVQWSINRARQALGQRAHDRDPFIQTFYKRGYRWDAEVVVLDGRSAPGASAIEVAEASHAQERLPFVGRAELMESFRRRLAQTQAGHGGLCLLVGEPGIGKTRCMDELALEARSLAFATWSGRATEDRWAPALWPWTQVLRCAAEERAVGRAGPLIEQLQALAGSSAEREASADAEPHPARFMLLDAVGRFLLEASRRKPLLVLLDDLHWADAGTIGLLAVIAPELRRHPLLIVASQRDFEDGLRARRPPQLARYTERVDVLPLTVRDVGQYIGLLTHAEAPAVLSQAVHAATAGNALFVQETVRALIAQHGVAGLSKLSPADVKPPQLAWNVLRERLGVLGHEARTVLSTASVLGESFDTDLLRAVSGVAVDALLGALDAAARAGFVRAEGPNRHRFCHVLVRNVLYEDLPASVRIATHRRAAVSLERVAHVVPRHGELAYHYHCSLALGQPATVTAAAQRAAEQAVRAGELEDAATFSQWALESQALDVAATPRQRGELLLLRARTARHVGRREDARAAIASLVELASEHRLADLLVRAARLLRPGRTWTAFNDPVVRRALEEALRIASDESDESRISALGQLASVTPYARDMQRSKDLSGEALALARRSGKPALLAEALRARLYALSGPDDIDAVLSTAEEMLALDGDAASWISIAAHSARYGAAILRGDLAGADQALGALGRSARKQRRPEALWYHDRLSAQRRFIEGDFPGAETAFAELENLHFNYRAWMFRIPQALLVIERHGAAAAAAQWDLPAFVSLVGEQPIEAASLARIAVKVGREDIARPLLEGLAADDFDRIPEDIGYLNTLVNLSLVAIAFEDRPRAERLYALLARYPHHNTPSTLMYYEGSVSHFLALLAELLGEHGRVPSHFDDALAMNESLGHKAQLARTYYEYARFLLTAGAGSQKRARHMKVQAAALAATLGMSALEAQARAL